MNLIVYGCELNCLDYEMIEQKTLTKESNLPMNLACQTCKIAF